MEEAATSIKPVVFTGDTASNCKRSVRFLSETEKELATATNTTIPNDNSATENNTAEYVPIKKQSSLFNNALRPNSAVRQLFPSAVDRPTLVLTHEALRAFDESKRCNNTLISDLLTSSTETDAIRKTMERNTLRRSLLR